MLSPFARATDILIINADGPGEGFNDPAPATPIGGNPATTVGGQRLLLFKRAASLWAAQLDSNVPIRVEANFDSLTCAPTMGVLGSAGTTSVYRDFPGAPQSGVWYHSALADSLRGSDLTPGDADIATTFNSQVNGSPGCLGGSSWYYGFDHNEGSDIDLLAVLLHELAHGLGFSNFVNLQNGSLLAGFSDTYTEFLRDNDQGLTWPLLTDAQRVTSALNTGDVVWNGPIVLAAAGVLTNGTDGSGRPEIYAPGALELGSSIAHFSTAAAPNLLMEPFITSGLTDDLDLTDELLEEVGWQRPAVPNTLPVAVDDSFNLDEDTTLVVAPADSLLDNDSDADGDALTVSALAIEVPQNGVLSNLAADGTFSYVPNTNFSGSDRFVYEISDGRGAVHQAAVQLLVMDSNDAPNAEDDAFATPEDTSLQVFAPGVLGNDSDPDDDSLSVLPTPVTAPQHGTLNVLTANGAFTYDPDPNYSGQDSFTYRISDGAGGFADATVRIDVQSVNDAPVAVADFYLTPEDNPIVAPPQTLLVDNDSDVDGDSLTVETTPVVAPAMGGLVLGSDGSFAYTPFLNFNGTDSFVYRVEDPSGEGGEATATLTIAAVNDPPTAFDDNYSMVANTTLSTPQAALLTDNDSDVDGDVLTVLTTPVEGPFSGMLQLFADGGFSYTPNNDFAGTDTFRYQVDDGNNGTATALVTITVVASVPVPVPGWLLMLAACIIAFAGYRWVRRQRMTRGSANREGRLHRRVRRIAE